MAMSAPRARLACPHVIPFHRFKLSYALIDNAFAGIAYATRVPIPRVNARTPPCRHNSRTIEPTPPVPPLVVPARPPDVCHRDCTSSIGDVLDTAMAQEATDNKV
jgi:hypothetical protein